MFALLLTFSSVSHSAIFGAIALSIPGAQAPGAVSVILGVAFVAYAPTTTMKTMGLYLGAEEKAAPLDPSVKLQELVQKKQITQEVSDRVYTELRSRFQSTQVIEFRTLSDTAQRVLVLMAQ